MKMLPVRKSTLPKDIQSLNKELEQINAKRGKILNTLKKDPSWQEYKFREFFANLKGVLIKNSETDIYEIDTETLLITRVPVNKPNSYKVEFSTKNIMGNVSIKKLLTAELPHESDKVFNFVTSGKPKVSKNEAKEINNAAINKLIYEYKSKIEELTSKIKK